MARFTTQRTGSWSDTNAGTTPWSSLIGSGTGGVPGNGDTVTIATGHTLTVDTSQTVGTSGPTVNGIAAPTVSPTTGATPTSLPTGNYFVTIVPVTAGGVEGSSSPESAVLTLTNGSSTPRITLPALPAGASSWSVYITNTGSGANGVTHRRYATGKSGSTNFEPVSASWEDGTVAFASAQLIAFASAIRAVGALVIGTGVTLTTKGDIMTSATSGTTMNAGSSLVFSADASITYILMNGMIYAQYSPLICNGSSGSRCSVSCTGGGVARIGSAATNSTGFVQATYTDFTTIGSASVRAIDAYFAGTRTLSFANCTFTTCGIVQGNNFGDGDSFILTSNVWSGSVGTQCTVCDCSAARTTGTRSITNNVFDITVSIGFRAFTVTDNYFGDAFYCMSAAVGRSWTTFSRNFVNRLTSVGSVQATCYDISNSYLFLNDSSILNPHPFDPSTINEDRVWSGNVIDGDVVDNVGDVLLPSTVTPASSYTLTIKHNVFLPGTQGDNIGTPITCYGNSKLTLIFNHNTFIMGTQGISYGESGGYTGFVGMWSSVRSNIAWNPSALSTGYFMWDGLGPSYDAVAGSVTNVDYNWKWNHSTSSSRPDTDPEALARGYVTGDSGGSNYAFTSGTVPGDHDGTGNPSFVDSQRCLATFDVGFLSKSIGTTWTDATAYAVGDIVSATTAGVWFGQTINYRCILAHTSSSGSSTLGKPGLGTSGSGNTKQWSTRWELASRYWIRRELSLGTTYTDTTVGIRSASIIEAARSWVFGGFAPTNSELRVAGHDTAVMGARNFAKTTRSLTRLTSIRSTISTRYGISV